MISKQKLVLVFVFLFISFSAVSQETIKSTIKQEAEKMSEAVLNGDYDLLMEYTHPNVIKFSGGKQKMIDYLEEQLGAMASNGFSFDAVEIGEPTALKLHKGAYQTLVPKTTTMTVDGQKIISKDYLFGFSDSEGKKWTFVEAEKLKSEVAKQLFPDFETDIEIPEKESPIVIDSDGSVEVLEIDENEGTYDTQFETGSKIGYILGLVFGILFFIGLLVGIVFLVVYLTKKKKVEPVTASKPEIKQVSKVTCAECESANNPDSKYCAFCGHTLPR